MGSSHVFWQHFEVEILEWSGDSWQAYKAKDLQVQFFMMSPYVLKNLTHDNNVSIQKEEGGASRVVGWGFRVHVGVVGSGSGVRVRVHGAMVYLKLKHLRW